MRSVAVEHWHAFGALVHTYRQAQEWSLRGLARALAITPSYLSMIEAGLVAPPSDAVIQLLAEQLAVPANTLFATAGRLAPAIIQAFWQHPAVAPVLSTIPGMTLEDAQTFCRQVLASLTSSPDETA
jgi:transcriptional regulator with XRE-family HTH domain